MEHECRQEETIARLKDWETLAADRLVEMEKRQIIIGADVSHIKGRIDNGLSATVQKLHDAALKQEPLILHHSKWINRLEAACVAALYGIGLLGCGVIIWAIAQGFKP